MRIRGRGRRVKLHVIKALWLTHPINLLITLSGLLICIKKIVFVDNSGTFQV